MLSVIGTVLKKDKKNTSNNADLVVQDNDGNTFSFQVRGGKKILKIAFIQAGCNVEVMYKNDVSEKKYPNGLNRFNNLILIDLKVL